MKLQMSTINMVTANVIFVCLLKLRESLIFYDVCLNIAAEIILLVVGYFVIHIGFKVYNSDYVAFL